MSEPTKNTAAAVLGALPPKNSPISKWFPSPELLAAMIYAFENHYSLDYISSVIKNSDGIIVGPKTVGRVLREKGIDTSRGVTK